MYRHYCCRQCFSSSLGLKLFGLKTKYNILRYTTVFSSVFIVFFLLQSYPLIIQGLITTWVCVIIIIYLQGQCLHLPFSGLLAIGQSSTTESNTVFLLHNYYLENWNAKILAKMLITWQLLSSHALFKMTRRVATVWFEAKNTEYWYGA